MREAALIAPLLERRGWRLAVAESCTGGLLGHWITSVPGSSAYFLGGVLAYANEIKLRLLDVAPASVERWGAVSAQVALEMAVGVCARTGAEVGVSITGIAGPGGGSAEKPVGLVYIGIALPGERRVWRHLWAGADATRATNKEASARAALVHLRELLARP